MLQFTVISDLKIHKQTFLTQMPNSPSPSTKFYFSILIGILAIGLSFYAVFFLHIKTPIQWLFVVLLLLAGITSLSVLWGGSFSIKEKYLTATNAFAVFFFLITIIFRLFSPPKVDSSLKIQVRNENGNSIMPNEKGVLKISIGKDTKQHDLNTDSEVLLTIPSDIDSIQIEVLADNWQLQAKHSKTAYLKVPETEVLLLSLEPDESRCCLDGRIIFADKKQKNLDNVTVRAAGNSAKTDEQGKYHLELPQNKRLENIQVEAYTTTHSGSVLCNSATPCDIKLTKK